LLDSVDHLVDAAGDVVIGQADQRDAFLREKRVLLFGLAEVGRFVADQVDRQRNVRAVKGNLIGPGFVIASEFQARDLAAAEARPEQLFGHCHRAIRHVATRFLTSFDDKRFLSQRPARAAFFNRQNA
jgi:hypothetical protein